MSPIVLAIVLVTVIGLIGAVILVAASIFMYVPVDERVEKITAALPGANCGACGCAGCADYAKSVEAANADLDGTAALCEEQGVVAKAAIAKKALPNCNIVCLTGDELKADASAYLQVLFDADPAAVGGALPGDDFYWTAE